MSSTSIKTPQQKANEESIEFQNDTNAELREDSKKDNGKESENEKPQSPEVRINMDEAQEHTKTGFSNKNFLLYECQSLPKPRKKVPTTLVYLGNMQMRVEPTGPPLDYSSDRNSFVRLVMILVFIMIVTTATCVTMVHCIESLNEFCLEYGIILFIIGTKSLSSASALSVGALPACCVRAAWRAQSRWLPLILFLYSKVMVVGISYAMTCSDCTRIFPCNIICLFITVFGMTLICSYITVRYRTDLVFLAVAATAGVVLVCVLLALTSFDFTKLFLYVVVISAAIGIVVIIFFIYTLVTGHYMKWVHFGILAASTVLSSVVLIMELQMILGGKAVELSEDDYAIGAFMVYTAIIDIFIKMLMMLGILDSID